MIGDTEALRRGEGRSWNHIAVRMSHRKFIPSLGRAADGFICISPHLYTSASFRHIPLRHRVSAANHMYP